MRGTTHRILILIVALFALQLGSLVAPAYACGCGAMIPGGGSRIGVDRETSAVRWDARTGTERIVMRFTVRGDAEQAAWVMPVPHRADVALGDPALFDALDRMTWPEHRERTYFWPRAGDWPFSSGDTDGAGAAPPTAKAPDVGVVGRERLGPFDVARLTATDPTALGDWLHRNGFELPDRLSAELRPYVQQKWEYVAVRLAPEKSGEPLRGALDPLRITFRNDSPVYPMRLSRLAKTPQALDLYILSDHRMEPRDAIGGDRPTVTFAGAIDRPEGPVAELAGRERVFFTAVEQYFPRPALIDGDHRLTRAAEDTPYRRVYEEYRLMTVGDGIPVWLLTVLGALLAVGAIATGLVAVARVRRAKSGVRSAA
ncbi:DUF2330 domain-containing protein [Streptomyces sp. NPDC085481]|uniref:DUF2330 domain-containing protein n=1 Tax=Streptomyces sp. NPDC085481 TaxID=3365727 RepID=UPI0037D53849